MDTLPSDMIDHILTNLDTKSYGRCLETATLFHTYRLNNVNYIRYLCHKYPKLNLGIINKIIRNNDLDAIQCVCDIGFICRTCVISDAAADGHLDIVKAIYKEDWDPYTNHSSKCKKPIGKLRAIDRAAAYGHLNVVKWLYEYRSEDIHKSKIRGIWTIMEVVKEREHNDVIGYLSQQKIES